MVRPAAPLPPVFENYNGPLRSEPIAGATLRILDLAYVRTLPDMLAESP
jgi:hypothetical protein